MAIVGVTGHTNLTGRSVELVRHEFLNLLRPRANDLVGLTCLARGADQAFADAVLELGGALQVVVPASDYFTGISDPVGDERLAAATPSPRLTVAAQRPAPSCSYPMAASCSAPNPVFDVR